MDSPTDNPASDEPLVLGADDSFLPSVGRTHYGPRQGYLKHYQQVRHVRFVVVKRDINTREMTELSTHGQAREAVAAFNQARLHDATPHDAIELLEWVSGGWRLTTRAPMLREPSAADDAGREFVWGQHGDAIGVVRLWRPQTWELLMRDGDSDRYSSPGTFSGAHFPTRVEAIEKANDLAPHAKADPHDDWPSRWAQPTARFRAAQISTTTSLSYEFIGPAVTACSAPGCTEEALVRVRLTGLDIAPEQRLACAWHGGEASARQAFGLRTPNSP